MFAINLRRVYCACDKIIVRTLRNRRLEVPGPNPGLDRRVTALREEGVPITGNPEEFLDQSESEFYNMDDTYNAHLTESLAGKHDLRHRIVKEKYFKENMPNLLTWSEKEQIRHLVNAQPNEWTPERIAESFPVTAAVVKKLLKYPWKPATEARIARHDESAMRNWRELKENTLDIPQDLRQHFLKFSERTIPPLKAQSVKPDVIVEKMGEFEKIVQRCAEKANNNNIEETDSKEVAIHASNNTNSKYKVVKGNQRVTLEEMTTKIKNRLDSGKAIDLPDQIMLSAVNSTETEVSATELSKEIDLAEEKPKEVSVFKEQSEEKTSVMEYPERIRIPKKAYKKGATYKVDDCYYDDDGKFLYRVLGMSN
ncbi:uncharacterized protein LOC134656504 [Cydia amplana]|uniref:uncharacterized protein LOC134656504 n=1 Tax=Cydia amplana TaxID=1869771 RepID=UPI002FE4FFFB